MSGFSHVDREALYAGPADEFDAANARLIDGRAIHHFLQYVAPLILERWPEAVTARDQDQRLGESSRAVLSPKYIARTWFEEHVQPGDRKVVDTIHSGLETIPVLGRRTMHSDLRALIGGAFDSLRGNGLMFFIELAVGAIAWKPACPDDWRGPCVAVATGTHTQQLTESLLSSAAQQFCLLWMQAEFQLNEPDRDAWKTCAGMDMSSVFGGCVVRELRRRESGAGSSAPLARRELPVEGLHDASRFSEWLAKYISTPLCRELLACWYPGWRRSLVIFNSPFDPLPRLESQEAGA